MAGRDGGDVDYIVILAIRGTRELHVNPSINSLDTPPKKGYGNLLKGGQHGTSHSSTRLHSTYLPLRGPSSLG